MWMSSKLRFSFVFIAVIPIFVCPTVNSITDQSSVKESFLEKKRFPRSTNNNVLWNTEPPTIVEELPLSITFYSSDVLNLKCNIAGNPRPNYQWFAWKEDLADRWMTIQDLAFNKIASANHDTLAIDGKMTKKTYFKYVYYCSAQNSLGTLFSNKIIVEKVTRPPSITVKYILNSVYEGEKFVAQCHLVPDLVPLYKFKRWEVRLKPSKIMHINETVGRFSVIHSTKFPQLHIRNVTNEDFIGTKVRCIFQSTIDSRYDVEDSIFRPIEKYMYEDLPYLTKLVCTGETVTAKVGTNIELPWCSVPRTLNVTWYKIDDMDSKKKIEIGKNANDSKFSMVSRRYGNLLIMNVTKDDSGKYLVTGTTSQFETIFTLNVYETPAISLSPKNIKKKLFERAQFLCKATFTKSNFRWLHNGIKVSSGYDDGNIEILDTNTSSTLRIKKIQLSVSGVYQCIASSIEERKGLINYRQISGTLLLPEVPPILVKQSPKVEKDSLTAQVQMSQTNNFQTIECIFAANPRPNIEWYHDSNKVLITNKIAMSIQQDQNSIYNFIAKMTINLNEMDYGEDILKYAGEYEARATNIFGSKSCNTFILMNGNLDIRLPAEQTAVGGEDYLMTCYFMAIEVPEFSWDRKIETSKIWESLPSNHRTNFIEKGHKLLLKSVIKSEDEGVYRCTIKHNQKSKVGTSKFLVTNRPILQNLPTKHDSSQSQTHICTPRNAPDKPWYTWWTFTKYNSSETVIISPNMKNSNFTVYYTMKPINGEQLLPGVPQFLFNYPNTGVDLYIKARSHDKDSFGKFVCHARNHIGSDEKTIDDNFLGLEFKISPPSSSEVVVGDDLYLDCTAKDSDLKPFVKWRLSKEDKNYTDINSLTNEYNGRIFQYDNGTLVMKNIKESDPSKLFCFIFPTAKSNNVQSKISYIEIRVPARIKRLKNEIFMEAGSSFNLSCDVYGHTQNMMVSWLYRSSSIGLWGILHEACIYSNENQCLNQYQSNSGKFTPVNEIHNRTYHTVHLEFRDVVESVSGQYKCEAKNKYNTDPDKTSTTLTIISKPSIVIRDLMQKDSSTSTSVTFDWKPPENNGNRPILHYIITYYEISSQKNNAEHRNLTQKIIRVNSTVQFLVIDQLRPYKNYGITISAENEVGVSEPVTFVLMTQEAKPQKSVNNLIASSTRPHEILVSWMDPDPEYQNGHIIRYQMCYQIISTTAELKTSVAFDNLNWPDNSLEMNLDPNAKCYNTEQKKMTVSDLPQFTDFAIRVIAFNSKGASPALYTKVRTLEDLPQAAPTLVTCEGQHQAISLTWNPPGRQTVNGVLIGYEVYYYQPNKYNDESGMKNNYVQGRTNFDIEHLKPYTSYSIQVMAVNRKGLGPPSGSVFCTTKEAKPEAPEVVKVVRINNTCSMVSWLHTSNPNGIIREYCVIGFGYNSKNPICQPPDMNKRYNVMVLCDPYERYSNVKVYAKNQYNGAFKETSRIEDINGIISIGGYINVKEGSSVILPCETASESYRNIYWKKDRQEIKYNEFQNIKIFNNFSLEISAIEKYARHVYSCSTDTDSIEYNLVVEESTDGIPKTPIIDNVRVTENSVFIRWKSQGTSDMAVPITGFIVYWRNNYTGDSKTVTLNEKARSFYLNNVTCASDFIIKVCSQSGNGKSKFSEPKILRTLGSVPQIADSSLLLPRTNINSNSANFNLLAFAPGQNCSATYFTIEISLTSMGSLDFNDLIFSKNISIYELENKCCYKVTGLNPLTTYKYYVTAYNPAGHTFSYNIMDTPKIIMTRPEIYTRDSIDTVPSHSWLLMIILVIVIIFVLIIVVIGILYILRSKEKKLQPTITKVAARKNDYSQNRIEKPGNHEDTVSIDSEPSPYAVYQPDPDNIRNQQLSQPGSTPLYNISDHHYNKIRYDKIPRRIPGSLDNHHDIYRRAISAECLSSLGNASMTGLADLESPSNIDPNNTQDYFRAPFNHCPDSDEVFQNIGYPDFSTVNKKRMRRESENLNRNNTEETSRLMKNSGNQGAMNMSRYYEHNNSRTQLQQQQQQQQQKQQINSTSGNPHHRVSYRQQMSVPEPSSMYQQQYGYPNNRLRTSSGSGRTHPSSQTILSTNPGSSAQVSGYGSYYGQRNSNIQPYSTTSGIRREEPPKNVYSSYVPGSSLANYNPPLRTVVARPNLQPVESPDEGIYTDRVIVV